MRGCACKQQNKMSQPRDDGPRYNAEKLMITEKEVLNNAM